MKRHQRLRAPHARVDPLDCTLEHGQRVEGLAWARARARARVRVKVGVRVRVRITARVGARVRGQG